MNYYAMLDTEAVVALGNCENFDEADERAPANAHWLFCEDALLAFITSAQQAIASRHVINQLWNKE